MNGLELFLRHSSSRLGRCPSTVRAVFPMLVFQLSNRTVLGQPPQSYSEPLEPYSDKEVPIKEALRVPKSESAENRHFHHLDPMVIEEFGFSSLSGVAQIQAIAWVK